MADPGPRTRELITMGVSIAGSVVLGLLLGFLCDTAFTTSPLFLFVGLALGIAFAVLFFVLQMRRFSAAEMVLHSSELHLKEATID